jgi:hypothetical protein
MRNKERGYTILFVSNRSKKVKTIRVTLCGIILTAVLAAGVIAGAVGYAAHGASVRKEYEKRIETLDTENQRLQTENMEMGKDK